MTIESKLLLLTIECEFFIFMFIWPCDELYSCYVLGHLFNDANEFRLDQYDLIDTH